MLKLRDAKSVALVTGAGRRLGRRIAVALGGAGFDVVVNYNKSKEGAEETVALLQKIGVDAFSIHADVSKQRDVSRMVKDSVKRFGRIDVLVNNSGVFSRGGIEQVSEEVWTQTLDVNLKGAFFCSQAVAPIMLKQKNGCIINIASLGGMQSWHKHLPYSVSKAGIIMLTKLLAKSLAPRVRVNAVAPGTIIMKGEEDQSLKHVPLRKIPLGTYGRPEDITDLVIFLATKGKYITGQTIIVDGGRSIM